MGPCSAGLVHADGRVEWRRLDGAHGNLSRLPLLVAELLDGRTAPALQAVAVTVGPGSFTGIRAALALAHGLGLAAGCPVLGVTTGAALAFDAPPDRAFWTVTDSRRGRIYLEQDGAVLSCALDAVPDPEGPVVVSGNAARAVVERLLHLGFVASLAPGCVPAPSGIAAAARRASLPAQPLYVDAPEARPSSP